MNCRYPTLGQVIRFAFDACGVMPRKRSERNGMSEQDKKRIQKQLQRLAAEEGKLLENAHAVIDELGGLLAVTVAPAKAVIALRAILHDLFAVYCNVVRSDGTYMSVRDTIGWFCRAYAIPRLAFSVRKLLLRLNIVAEGFRTPSDSDWYLPTVTDEGVTWPLAKALHWTYGVCDTKQTHFHFPGMNTKSECPEQTQHLDNARQWCKGKSIPSWNSLHWNITRSFGRLSSVEDSRYQRDIPEALRENILLVLFVARLSTYVCKAIADAFGTDCLAQIVAQYRRQDSWLEPHIEVLKQEVNRFRIQMLGSGLSADEACEEVSENYWQWFSDHAVDCGKEIQHLLDRHGKPTLPEETIRMLLRIEN